MPLWVTRTSTRRASGSGSATSPGTSSHGARRTIALMEVALYTYFLLCTLYFELSIERFRIDRVSWRFPAEYRHHLFGRLALELEQRLFRVEAGVRGDDDVLAAEQWRAGRRLL